MENFVQIAIDGPAAAGKSTIAKIVAKKLGFIYVDTGAMYRAVALKVYRLGLQASDETAIVDLLPSTHILITYSGGIQKVLLDGENVSKKIREHHISKVASDVSAIHAVRLWLVDMQREIAKTSSCILDGRDIGTYVLPNAKHKFYLTASIAVRARRRYDELQEKGESSDLDTIARDIAQRDHNDSTRSFAPLKKADDAIEVDTSDLTVKEVVEVLLAHIYQV